MTDRPILFSAPMVKALLAGTKTQTRRVTKVVQPDRDKFIVSNAHGGLVGVTEDEVPSLAPDFVNFEVGDRLWVRESWRTIPEVDGLPPREISASRPILTEADTDPEARRPNELWGKLRPGMFMPRWASRLTLTVTEVRVERLQNISELDAQSEGITRIGADHPELLSLRSGPNFFTVDDGNGNLNAPTAAGVYRMLWDMINGEGAWAANPWVVAVSFTVQHQNIDALQEAA